MPVSVVTVPAAASMSVRGSVRAAVFVRGAVDLATTTEPGARRGAGRAG